MSTSAAMDPWTALELAKLLVGVLTPLSVAVLGFLLSRHLKQLDLLHWRNQKLLEKRIAIYDQVAPLLNELLCYYTWVGDWKLLSPPDVIAKKRVLDKTFHVYRHLFAPDVFTAYLSFMDLLFETYNGVGQDARIRTVLQGVDGDRREHTKEPWQDEWSARFTEPDKVAPPALVRSTHEDLMAKLTASFGVHRVPA